MKALFLACIFMLAPTIAYAQGSASVTLQWDPNTEPDLAGYNVYNCLDPAAACSKQQNSGVADVGKVVMTTLPGTFQEGVRFFVTAYDASANESGPSNVVILGIAPQDPTGLTITITITITP